MKLHVMTRGVSREIMHTYDTEKVEMEYDKRSDCWLVRTKNGSYDYTLGIYPVRSIINVSTS